VTDDGSGESMEPMGEVPLVGLGESELEKTDFVHDACYIERTFGQHAVKDLSGVEVYVLCVLCWTATVV